MRNVKRLHNAVRAAAVGTQNDHADSKIGLVSAFDQARYAVKVFLQPQGNETGWLPLGAVWVGAGWGMYAPPTIGDMCIVDFAEGHGEAGHAALRFFNDVDQALAANSGEFWLVHKSGANFKLLNTGALTVSDGKGATITLNGDGSMTSQATSWTHTGNITLDGNLTQTGGINSTQDIVAGGISLMTHPHGGVESGPDLTGPPA